MPDYFLRTPRLGFRQWSINDLPLALDLWGDPEVSRFLGGPFSREAIEEKLTKEIATLKSIKFNIGPSFCWPTTITLDAPGYARTSRKRKFMNWDTTFAVSIGEWAWPKRRDAQW